MYQILQRCTVCTRNKNMKCDHLLHGTGTATLGFAMIAPVSPKLKGILTKCSFQIGVTIRVGLGIKFLGCVRLHTRFISDCVLVWNFWEFSLILFFMKVFWRHFTTKLKGVIRWNIDFSIEIIFLRLVHLVSNLCRNLMGLPNLWMNGRKPSRLRRI
jgi:hypothetical protein